MAETFPIEVVTPSRVVYSGEVEMVRAPGTKGSFQVFHMHLPLLSTLEVGEMDLRETGGKERALAVSGGFVEVLRDKVNVLAETAEFADEIDVERAEHAAERARERLHLGHEGVDRNRAELALEKAINRLRIAKRAHM